MVLIIIAINYMFGENIIFVKTWEIISITVYFCDLGVHYTKL